MRRQRSQARRAWTQNAKQRNSIPIRECIWNRIWFLFACLFRESSTGGTDKWMSRRFHISIALIGSDNMENRKCSHLFSSKAWLPPALGRSPGLVIAPPSIVYQVVFKCVSMNCQTTHELNTHRARARALWIMKNNNGCMSCVCRVWSIYNIIHLMIIICTAIKIIVVIY